MRTDRLTNRRGDRGAVLVIVAAFAVVAVIFLAFVIDVGGLRAERKEVTLSTDAASLAGANTIDFDALGVADIGSTTCDQVPSTDGGTIEAVVRGYLARNGDSTFQQCKVVIESIRNRRAYVTVGGMDDVQFQVGPAIGQSSGTTRGVSSAGVGIVDGGIRPFGICGAVFSLPVDAGPVYGFPTAAQLTAAGQTVPANYFSLLEDSGLSADPAATGGLDGSPGTGSFPVPVFPIQKVTGEGSCGDAPGNFGQLDLAENGGGNGSGSCVNPQDDDKLCDNTINGYQGELKNPGRGDTGSDFTEPLGSAFDVLEADRDIFWVAAYSSVSGTGSNAVFSYQYWVKVRAVDHCFKNACRITALDGAKKNWFEWEIRQIVPATGAYLYGPPLTEDYEEFTARLCGVDGDESYC